MDRLKSALLSAVGIVVACLVIFVLVEGLSSTCPLAWGATKARGFLGSRKHVRFDHRLGWTNKEGTSLKDRFGPGKHVTIDGLGLRAGKDPSKEIPDGKRRILCTGDSFTFGKGNGDDETWCARLAARHPEAQVLNAGEEAYGIGQIHLKGERLMEKLDWNVQVFAFIADDVRRMTTLDFIGRNKPRLVLDEGKLQLQNFPVRRSSDTYLWFRANRRMFQNLRFLELGQRLGRKFSSPPAGAGGFDDRVVADTLGTILETTHRLNTERGGRALFVFLPSGPDFNAPTERWRPLFLAQCKTRNLDCIDAVAPFDEEDEADLRPLYDPVYAHYSAEGNVRIAKIIDEALTERGLWTATATTAKTPGTTADPEKAP